MFNYEIGGNEIKPMASEGIADIPFNRTLLALQLTDKEPVTPELVTGLKTVEDVFNRYQPNVDVEFEDENGTPVQENLKFGSIADFRAKALSMQSPYLRSLDGQYSEYTQISRRLKGHRILQTALDNPDAKAALVAALKSLVSELDAADTE